MALARSPLVRLTIVGCFGGLALALTACSTLSRAPRADSVINLGPPRTIEAALPPDGEIAWGATATAPEADLTLLAAGPLGAETATDAMAQSPEPAADTAARDTGMAQARDSIMGDSERSDAGLLSAGILLACGAAIAGWAIYRRRSLDE